MLAKLPYPATPPEDDTIRIGYAGTVVAQEAFAAFVAGVKAARAKTKRKIEIHLYSWHAYRDRPWFDPEIIIEHGSRTEEEVYQEYRKMNWGLVLMHTTDEDPRYNRFSFPCKFTSALATGIPLICMGHHESTLIQLSRRYDLGLLLTDEDQSRIGDILAAGLVDTSRLDHFLKEGARCANEEFSAARNREALNKYIEVAMTARTVPITNSP